MHSFQHFIVWLIPKHPLPLETRIWKLVVRALVKSLPAFKQLAYNKLERITSLIFVISFPNNKATWALIIIHVHPI